MGCSPEGGSVNPPQQSEPDDFLDALLFAQQDQDAFSREEAEQPDSALNATPYRAQVDNVGGQATLFPHDQLVAEQQCQQESRLNDLMNPDDVYLDDSKQDDFMADIGKMYAPEAYQSYQPPAAATNQAEAEERIESLFACLPEDSASCESQTVPLGDEQQQYDSGYEIGNKHERTAKINKDVFDAGKRFAGWEDFVRYCFPGVYFSQNQFLAAITEDAVVVMLLEPEFCSGICRLADEKCFVDLDALEFPVFGLIVQSTRFSQLFVKSQSLQAAYLISAALDVLALAECAKLQNVQVLSNGKRCMSVYTLLLVEDDFVNYCGCQFRIIEQPLEFLSEMPSDAFLRVLGTRDYTQLRFSMSATRAAFRAAKDGYMLTDRSVEVKSDKVEELVIESNFAEAARIMPQNHIGKLRLCISQLRELCVEGTDLRYLDLTEMQWIFRLNIANNPKLLLNKHYLPCTLEYLQASNANLVAVNFFALSHLRKCDISRNKLECTTLYGQVLLEFAANNCEFTSAFSVEIAGATLMHRLSLNGAVNCGLTCQTSSNLRVLDLLHVRVVRYLNLEQYPLLETVKLECGETAVVEGRPPASLVEVQLMGCVVSRESQCFGHCKLLKRLDLQNCKLGWLELSEALTVLNLQASDVGKLDLRRCGALAHLNVSLTYNLTIEDALLPETLMTLSAVKIAMEVDANKLPRLKKLEMSQESLVFKGRCVPRTICSVGTLTRCYGVLEASQHAIGRCLWALLDWRCDEESMRRIEDLRKKTENLGSKLASARAHPEQINISVPRRKPKRIVQKGSAAVCGPSASARSRNPSCKPSETEALAALPEGILDFAAAQEEGAEELLDVSESDQ